MEGGFQEEISMESDISNNCNNAVFFRSLYSGTTVWKEKSGSLRLRCLFTEWMKRSQCNQEFIGYI